MSCPAIHDETHEPSPCPHEPFDWCAFHHRCEPISDATYRVCGECWHAFQTREELINEANFIAFMFGASLYDSRGDVQTCPLCTHDF